MSTFEQGWAQAIEAADEAARTCAIKTVARDGASAIDAAVSAREQIRAAIRALRPPASAEAGEQTARPSGLHPMQPWPDRQTAVSASAPAGAPSEDDVARAACDVIASHEGMIEDRAGLMHNVRRALLALFQQSPKE